jgi:putative membrane protein
MVKFFIRVITNGAALYIIPSLLVGFSLESGWRNLLIGALVLAFLNSFIKPILKLIFKPVIWITLGFFNLVINMGLLWTADQLLPQIAIADIKTLFLSSLLVAMANLF